MSFNTGNALPSISEEDLYDNMANLDKAMNSADPTWRDRFNVEKPTMDAALKSVGFMPAGFDFVTGGTLQPGDRNKSVFNPSPNGDNNWYRWNGAFPKEIAAGSQPIPKDENNWVPVEKKNAPLRDIISVKDFGALGDGSGRTPADDGIDILSQPWNTWDNTPWKTDKVYSVYWLSGSFVPPRAKPFANDDTWDYIGTSRALWQAQDGKMVFSPAGRYVINLTSTTPKGGFCGISLMHGMEQSWFGAGKYATLITTKETSTFFANNFPDVVAKYSLVTAHRLTGVPTTIRDIGFIGPNSYSPTLKNLRLIDAQNCNGLYYESGWLTSCYSGIHFSINSSDSEVTNTTAEYCFGESVGGDETSWFRVNKNNLWASTNTPTQAGVVSTGDVKIVDTDFHGFYGGAINAKTLSICGGKFSGGGILPYITFESGNINGIVVKDPINGPQVKCKKDSLISGCTFLQEAEHPSIMLGNGVIDSATNITIAANKFKNPNPGVAPTNKAILAIVDGLDYVSAATPSVFISNNSFEGSALESISDATFGINLFNGVRKNRISGDETGMVTASGSSSQSSFTVQLSNMLGIGGTGLRDQQRLILVSVVANGAGFAGHAFALFSTLHDGNTHLVQTLGNNVVGGTIVFAGAGQTPTVQITSAGVEVGYVVSSRVLI